MWSSLGLKSQKAKKKGGVLPRTPPDHPEDLCLFGLGSFDAKPGFDPAVDSSDDRDARGRACDGGGRADRADVHGVLLTSSIAYQPDIKNDHRVFAHPVAVPNSADLFEGGDQNRSRLRKLRFLF